MQLDYNFYFRFLRIVVPFSLGTSQVITYSHPVKAMTNYCNFKSLIVLEESPLMNNPIIVKVSAVPKGDDTDIKKNSSNREAPVNNTLLKANQQCISQKTMLVSMSSSMIKPLKGNLLSKPLALLTLYMFM